VGRISWDKTGNFYPAGRTFGGEKNCFKNWGGGGGGCGRPITIRNALALGNKNMVPTEDRRRYKERP